MRWKSFDPKTSIKNTASFGLETQTRAVPSRSIFSPTFIHGKVRPPNQIVVHTCMLTASRPIPQLYFLHGVVCIPVMLRVEYSISCHSSASHPKSQHIHFELCQGSLVLLLGGGFCLLPSHWNPSSPTPRGSDRGSAAPPMLHAGGLCRVLGLTSCSPALFWGRFFEMKRTTKKKKKRRYRQIG